MSAGPALLEALGAGQCPSHPAPAGGRRRGGPWGSLARRGVAPASGGVSSWHDPLRVCVSHASPAGRRARSTLSCDLALATPQMTPFPSTAIFQGSRKDTKPGGGGHHPTQRSRGSASTAPLSAPSPAPEAGRPSQGDVLLDKAALPCGAPPRAGDAVPAPPRSGGTWAGLRAGPGQVPGEHLGGREPRAKGSRGGGLAGRASYGCCLGKG